MSLGALNAPLCYRLRLLNGVFSTLFRSTLASRCYYRCAFINRLLEDLLSTLRTRLMANVPWLRGLSCPLVDATIGLPTACCLLVSFALSCPGWVLSAIGSAGTSWLVIVVPNTRPRTPQKLSRWLHEYGALLRPCTPVTTCRIVEVATLPSCRLVHPVRRMPTRDEQPLTDPGPRPCCPSLN